MNIRYEKETYGRHEFVESLFINDRLRLQRAVNDTCVAYVSWENGKATAAFSLDHPSLTPSIAWKTLDNDWFALRRVLG